jgi:hypothetical protein
LCWEAGGCFLCDGSDAFSDFFFPNAFGLASVFGVGYSLGYSYSDVRARSYKRAREMDALNVRYYFLAQDLSIKFVSIYFCIFNTL